MYVLVELGVYLFEEVDEVVGLVYCYCIYY